MSFISGVGLTSYGKHEGSSSLDLMSKAAELAIADAGLSRSQVDGVLCGYSTVSPHIMLATVSPSISACAHLMRMPCRSAARPGLP
jgi:3-oxoacyl-[acyl-carrier-protein] synthase III